MFCCVCSLSSPFLWYMFKERSLSCRLLFNPFCLKMVVRACLNLYSIVFCVLCVFWFGSDLVSFSPLCSKEGSWRLSKSLLYCFLCMLVPLSSPFLLDVQRKVLGACQNRLLVPLSSPFHSFPFEKTFLSAVSIFTLLFLFSICWFRSHLLFSFNFHERSWRLSKSSDGSSLVSLSLLSP
jgi:hypothetical protein